MENIPRTIGSFSISGILGQGGMGVVYRAVRQHDGLAVALKTLKVNAEMSIASIRNEIRALARIQHPGIVRILDEGIHDGVPWYAMELITGQTLNNMFFATDQDIFQEGFTENKIRMSNLETIATSSWWTTSLGGELVYTDPNLLDETVFSSAVQKESEGFATGRLNQYKQVNSIESAVDMVRKICSPLAFLHGEGIVHRDLKPGNIIVRDDGNPVIVDFGLMSWFRGEESRESLTIEQRGAGSIQYIAPEQIYGKRVDARADIYSLGCILYELLTGLPPFSQGQTIAEVIQFHTSVQPAPPSLYAEYIPEKLDTLVLKMLEKDPQDRLGYADVVNNLLGEFCEKTVTIAPAPEPRLYLYRSSCAGREQNFRELQDLFLRLMEGKGGLVFIAGESGVGKTRFVKEFINDIYHEGVILLTGACIEPVGHSLSAFQKPLLTIADRCRNMGLEETERVLGLRGKVLSAFEQTLSDLPGQEDYPEPVELPLSMAKLRLYNYLLETLLALSEADPVIIIIDDLHWADEISLECLEFLKRVTPFQDHRILIVATYRVESLSPRITKLIEGKSSDISRHIVLSRLGEESISLIASEMLAMSPAPSILCQYLHKHSEGNPYFIVEYLRAAMEDGLLARNSDGLWSVQSELRDFIMRGDEETTPLPSTLFGLINRRLADLDPDCQKLLNAAAVLGRECPIALLMEMSHSDEEKLDALVKRYIIEKSEHETIRFSYAKIRDIALGVIPEKELRLLHQKAAEGIEKIYTNRIDDFLPQLALHWESAGDVEKAKKFNFKAAIHARSLFNLHQSEKFFRRCLSFFSEPTEEAIVIRNEFGSSILSVLGKNEEAIDIFRENIHESQKLELPKREAESLRFLGDISWLLGQYDKSQVALQKSLIIAESLEQKGLFYLIMGSLASLYALQGNFSQAKIYFRKSLKAMIKWEKPIEKCVTLSNLANVYNERGENKKAFRLNEIALDIALELGERRVICVLLGNVANYYHEEGLYDKAQPFYERALALAKEVGDLQFESMWQGNLARLHHQVGRIGPARSLYYNAYKIACDIQDKRSQVYWLVNIAALERQTSDSPERTEDAINKALTILDEYNNPFFSGLVYCEQGHLALSKNRSGQKFLEEATEIYQKYNVGQESDLGKALHKLAHSQKLFDQGKVHLLRRGE